MGETIINKVAESGLVTLDLEQYYPAEEVVLFDLKDFLFMELILKEKDFREALKKWDWEIYRDKNVGVVCTADAIIPPWAYMLAASYLQPVAKDVVIGEFGHVNLSDIFKKNHFIYFFFIPHHHIFCAPAMLRCLCDDTAARCIDNFDAAALLKAIGSCCARRHYM